MDAIEQLRRLLAHSAWADAKLLAALRATPEATAAWREYAHMLGTAAVWLARLEARPAPVAVWPTLTLPEAETLRQMLVTSYDAYLAQLDTAALQQRVQYTNSAGQTFQTPIGDILLHVVLHGQYHRGKINLLLRQEGAAPAPVDYIAYVRGAPAAVTPMANVPRRS